MSNLTKIQITTEADSSLNQALEKVNINNPSGRISKTDLASYFIQKISASLSENLVEEIRFAHFNQITFLDSLLKSAKRDGRESLSEEEMQSLQIVLKRQAIKTKSSKEKVLKDEPESSNS